ncbi:MAG: hypothetical protein DRP64_06795, partial [Verrucomicrobia bacterium]
ENYPEVERIYLHQVRTGCGVDKNSVDLRDRQRLLPDKYPYMSVMSTTGINEHDGCHFYYAGGYELVGDHIAALLDVDLYGSANTANTTAPNIKYMYFSTPAFNEITILMREPTDPLTFDAAAANDFVLQGSAVTVTSGTISPSNTIVLALSGDASGAEGLAYTGHSGPGAWVDNAAGVGLLTFFNAFSATSPVPPAAPATLAASALNSDWVTLSWDAVPNASSYLIRRDGVDLAVATSPQYTDAGLDPATTYQYQVAAVNIFGLSAFSGQSAATLPVPTAVPEAPAGLVAQPRSSSAVDLTWAAVTNAAVYRVRRDGAEVGTTAYGTSFSDTGLAADTDYSYEVRSENRIGNSGYSSPVAVRTQVLAINLNVLESKAYKLVYELDIRERAIFQDSFPVSYATDRSASVSGDFDRIAYWLQLDDQWVYVSMDAFTSDIKAIGLPHNVDNFVTHQRTVNNMNVHASAGAGITTGTSLTGNVEMWHGNYGKINSSGIPNASDDVYDFGDQNSSNAGFGYGSFQVHNHGAAETIFAYNGWGQGEVGDVGIGNRASANTDWTFAGTAGFYMDPKLYIFVRLVDDQDGDGLPNSWELLHFGNITNAVASAPAANGLNTLLETYVAGLDPNDPNSTFTASILPTSILQWDAVSGRVYSVYYSTNLLESFQPLETNIPWTAGGFTDSVHGAKGQMFYKTRVELDD